MGYSLPSAETYNEIQLWKDWYQGHHAKFHDYVQFNGRTKLKRTRKSLRMAKKVCEDHANLLMNEKVQITVDNTQLQEYLDLVLKANNFRVQSNKLVELAFALGIGAFVEYPDSWGNVAIDYIRADMIYPLSWEGEYISECAFGSLRTIGRDKMIYLNIHKLESDNYVIYNKLVPVEGEAREIQPDESGLLPGGVQPVVYTNSSVPRFQFIGPNAVNNVDLDSPLSISVFANSIDLLEGIDLVYDSYCNEFRLGKKRIVVPVSMMQLMKDETGAIISVFDDNDTEFYGMYNENLTGLEEINMELRTEAHEQGLQRFLNLLSDKCGLGNDRYNFQSGQVKTATEVVSEKSDLYQNLKKNELVLESALRDMCTAIAEIGGFNTDFETTINFDDSIIEDSDAKRNRMQLLLSQGKFPMARYLQEYEGYSKKEVKKIMAELNTESAGAGIEFDESEAEPTTSEDGSAKVTDVKQDVKETVGVTLNGAQVQSLIGVVKSVKAGEISRSAAIAIIMSSFGMTEEQANKLLAEDVV